MKMLIQALEAKVTQQELSENLSPETMKKLEGKVVHPYVVAEEGESRPKILGQGQKVLTWPRATIRRVKDFVKNGTKFFIGHNADSSHEGRESVGEVVGSFTRLVGGKLQALAVAVLKGDQSDMDVCSMEADVDMTGNGIVNDINKLTGIALGSSLKDSPAFPGAHRMGIVQCFGEAEQRNPLEKEDKTVTFEEVKKAIKDMNIFPSQVFSVEEIKKDRDLGQVYVDLEKANTDLKASGEKLEKLGTESKEAIKKTQLTEAKKSFDKLIPEGTTDQVKNYMLKKFRPEGLEDLTETGIKKAIEDLQTDYAEDAKLLGVTEAEAKSGDSTKPEGKEDDAVSAATKEIMGA